MSYTRSYSETVSTTVSKTVSVSYPASQTGGSTSVTVNMVASIPVDVNIHVDTLSFDSSVTACGNQVDRLTDAVVATEAATILSKHKNAKKVADTIISGFFSYVKSEISQQVSEISQNTDSLLMHIKELSKACLSKKAQMESDYNRITGRYIKTFTDLNNELANRIHQLDKPTFNFKKETEKQSIRAYSSDLANTVSVFGGESSALQARLGTSIAKKRALDTLNKVKLFLWQQKQLGATIKHSMLNESVAGRVFIPVCYVEQNHSSNNTDSQIFSPGFLPVLNEPDQLKILSNNFSSSQVKWANITPADEKSLRFYFNKELNAAFAANDTHTARVREMVQSISKLNAINVTTK